MNKKFTWILLSGILVLLFLAGCGTVEVKQDGFIVTMSYDDWLSRSEATEAAVTQWAIHGTPTPTATPTITPTPTTTATMTPSPTITPSPTATPFTGYWVVDNKVGEVIALAEFQPECSGEWGYPGMDVWRVENGRAVSKVCGTPWNRPQNMAVRVVGYAALALIAFVLIMIFSNEWRKYKLAKKRKAMHQQRQLPAQYASVSSDQVAAIIKTLGGVDKPLAERLLQFRKTYRQEMIQARANTLKAFASFVQMKDEELYEAVQTALEKAVM